jgi:hypothetical protein
VTHNPYSAAIKRWCSIAIGITGAVLFAFVAVRTLYVGSTDGCFTAICTYALDGSPGTGSPVHPRSASAAMTRATTAS